MGPALKKAKLSEEKQAKIASESESSSEELSEYEDLDVAESSDGSGSDEDVSDEEETTTTGAPKKDKFENAITAILGSKVKAHDQANPILIRNKRPAKEIEEAKEDIKARKALRAERLSQKDKARVRNVIPKDPEEAGDVIANEKKLRKIAQRGVVRLMNAINSAQTAAIAELNGDKKQAQASTDMSKEKFLDMLRMG